MKIAVLGAGNAGTALAADMALRGLDVTLVKTSRAGNEAHFAFLRDNGFTVVSSRAVVGRCALLSCCSVVGRCCALCAA